MTARQVSRSALFGIFLGICAWGVSHSVCRLTDLKEPWFLKFILIALALVVWLSYKVFQERVLLKDYEKMIDARRRRMR